mmetsp:Transcript_10853/g.16519  ORF Transcript_10853/g.16519 Transcript_10853/m.16519 type:complete len:747 (-) Transcript_10853:200-2440(-)
MTSHYREWCLFLFIIASISSFFPLYINVNGADFSYFDQKSSFDWKEYRLLCLAAVSTALPLFLDTLLDFKLPLRITGPRWVFVLALIIPNAISFFSTRVITAHTVSVAVCCVFCREFLMNGALLSFLLHRNCNKRTVIATSVMAFLTIVVLHIRLCFVFGVSLYGVGWMRATYALSSLRDLLLFAICTKRFVSMQPNSEEYMDTIYASLPVVGVALKAIVVFGADQLTYMIAVDIFLCIVATVLPGRHARHEKSIAEHILQSKRDFVSYISHELRTPLNTVYMGIQLLSSRMSSLHCDKQSDLHDIVSDIESSCCIAIDILSDLLVVNKVEDGVLQLDRKEQSVRQLLSTVVDPFNVQAQQKQIIFEHSDAKHLDPSIAEEETRICVDVSKFSQVLRNLISNALKFTPSGGRVDLYAFLTTRPPYDSATKNKANPIRRNTRVFSSMSESSVTHNQLADSSSSDASTTVLRIEVHDTGPGVSEENQKRLFNEIVQFNAAELQGGGGSGLGLWISKAIMDHHGGTLGVISTPGMGSIFYIEVEVLPPASSTCSTDGCDKFSLSESREAIISPSSIRKMSSAFRRYIPVSPKVNIVSDCEPAESAERKDSLERLTVGNITINKVLVVDDSSVNRKMICRLLVPLVGSVSQAGDGAEALQLVTDALNEGNSYDIVFMDVNMPVMDGVRATRLMRSAGYKGYITFLTGNAMPEERASFFSAGGDDVLIKPCTLANLEGVLIAAYRELRCTA